jgi:hypothetical protein
MLKKICQPIPKLELHESQCGKGSFFFNTINDLDNELEYSWSTL